LIWLLVLAVIGGATWYGYGPVKDLIASRQAKGKAQPPRVTPVVTATVRQGDMELYLNGLGSVTAFNTVTLRSRVEGELIKVAFTEGQMVRKGDVLAEIDPRPYKVQLDQAKGNLTRDQAALRAAQLDMERYNTLLSSRSVTQQQVDAQRAMVKQSQGAIQTDEASIDNAELLLNYCHITSPISGRIGLRLVDRGNIVRANDPNGMAVITQLQPIAVIFTIPQDEIGRVQQRLKSGAELGVTAYDRDFKMKLGQGVLAAVDNQVDPTTGTVRLKAVFQNEDGMLFPNQFVNARLLVDIRPNAVMVSSAAVQRGPDSAFVYVVKPDSTVELRKVIAGPSEGDETSIEKGLNPGEVVVTDGLDKLQPGAKVAVPGAEKSGALAERPAEERGAKAGQ